MGPNESERKSQPGQVQSPGKVEASLGDVWPEGTAIQPRLPKLKSIVTFIVIATLIVLLPVSILPGILFISRRIGLNTADPFVYFAILASILPGIVLILLPRIRPMFKVLGAILYVALAYPTMIIYAIVLFCLMYGECL